MRRFNSRLKVSFLSSIDTWQKFRYTEKKYFAGATCMHPSVDHTDAHLLEQTALGIADAFTQLFYRYKDSLHRLTWSVTGSRTIADDVLQEVFLKIWVKRNELSKVEKFSRLPRRGDAVRDPERAPSPRQAQVDGVSSR